MFRESKIMQTKELIFIEKLLNCFQFFNLVAAIATLSLFAFLPFFTSLFLIALQSLGIFFVKRHDINISMFVMYFSLCIYAFIFTYYFSPDYGFHYCLIPMICYCYIGSYKRIEFVIIVLLLAIAMYALYYYLFEIQNIYLNNKIIIFGYNLNLVGTAMHVSIITISFALISNAIRNNIYVGVNIDKNELKLAENYQNSDLLTGLINRNAFLEHFKDNIDCIYPCFAIIDINNFKSINAKYGYSTGDELLKMCSKVLLNHFKKDCLVCRWDSEKFLIFSQNTPFNDFKKRLEIFKIEFKTNANSIIQIDSSISVGAIFISKDFSNKWIDDYIKSVFLCLNQAKKNNDNKIISNYLENLSI